MPDIKLIAPLADAAEIFLLKMRKSKNWRPYAIRLSVGTALRTGVVCKCPCRAQTSNGV